MPPEVEQKPWRRVQPSTPSTSSSPACRIHRVAALELYAVDRGLLAELAARLERRMAFALAVTDRHLYVTLGDDTITGIVSPFALDTD